MNYYISDLHLFHNNVTKAGRDYDDRPFKDFDEMHSIIKEKWNKKVTNADTVYIVGDVAMRGTNEDLIAYVSTLKGKKVLILGNHDDVKDLRYRTLFDEICPYKEITDSLGKETVKVILCHYPILMWKDQHKGSILLYGHVHDLFEEQFFRKCLKELSEADLSDRRAGNTTLCAYNVGCMKPYIDYEPRSLEEIVKNYK